MKSGICKLCLLDKPLCNSHLMSSGIYKLCKAKDSPPVVFNGKVMMQSDWELQHPLLCFDCEQILSRKGENEIVPLLADIEGNFPLHDRLTVVEPFLAIPEVQVYESHKAAGVNFEVLTHFALGIFWKAGVHSWTKTSKEPWIPLGPYAEPIRKFLKGDEGFPKHIVLHVYIQRKPVKSVSFNMPVTPVGAMPRSHWFYIPGIVFLMFAGKVMPHELEVSCIYSHFQHPITVMDLTDVIANNVARLAHKSGRTDKLIGYMKSIEDKLAAKSVKQRKW